MDEASQSTDSNTVRLMRSHAYFHGLDEQIIHEVASGLVVQRLAPGETLFEANEPVSEIGFLVSGRLKGVVIGQDGKERLLKFAERGEAVGLISAAMVEPLPVTTLAVEPSTVLMLDYQRGIELTAKYPELRSHWNQKLAGALRADIIGDRRRSETTVLAVFHQSESTRSQSTAVVNRLLEAGETVCLFTDNAEQAAPLTCPSRLLIEEGQWLSEGQVHDQIGAWGKPQRVVVDVSASCEARVATRLLSLSQKVLWFANERNHAEASERLQTLEADSPAVRDKTGFVWFVPEGARPPYSSAVERVSSRSFVVSEYRPSTPGSTSNRNGLERLVNHVQGIQIGIALGGGAARGMAHLGVLRALQDAGVVVDQIAGTSAGAMTGLLYAAGYDPDYVVERFVHDLQPSWLFRRLPKGGYWYLTYKYRRGQFDPMLRKYLQDVRLEQLPIPASAVTVDLVSGQVMVRRTGDAVHAILDSINLPVLSKPILRDGQALIDGGFVNNVPANVLVSQGCNLIIAVDVLANIEKEFAGMRPDSSAREGSPPSAMQTVLRTYAVQSFNMNSIGVQPADIRIEPDTTSIGMSEFTKARELADIGEAATTVALPAIQALLSRLRPTTSRL